MKSKNMFYLLLTTQNSLKSFRESRLREKDLVILKEHLFFDIKNYPFEFLEWEFQEEILELLLLTTKTIRTKSSIKNILYQVENLLNVFNRKVDEYYAK